jgi:hypothetical protein
VLLQAGVSTQQQQAHLDTHLRIARDGSLHQVQDACSILGYTGPRVLEVMSPVAGTFEQLQVDAGDIVILMANTGHRGTPSLGDDSPLLFMYWDMSYRLSGDKGLHVASVQPVTPTQLTIKYLALHALAATMKGIFS